MASSSEYVVKLVVDASGAVTGIRNAKGEAVDLGRVFEKTGDGASRFGKIMDVAFGVSLAGVLDQTRSAVFSMAQEVLTLGASLEQADGKFRAVFRDGAPAMQAFLDEFATKAGMSDAAAKDLASSVGSIGAGAGMTGDKLADFSGRVIAAAADLENFNDVPIEETFAAIRSGLTGETEPLKRFGLFLNEAAIKAEALNVATKTGLPAHSQQVKQMAALNLIYQQMGSQGSLGAMAREMDTVGAQSRRLTAMWENMRDELARELLPTYTALIDALEAVTRFISENRKEIKSAAEWTAIIAASVAAYVAVQQAHALWTARVTIATKTLTIAQRIFNAVMKANPIGLVIAGLTLAAGIAYKFRKEIAEAAATFARWLASLADSVPFLSSVASGLRTAADRADKFAGSVEEVAVKAEEAKKPVDTAAGAVGDLGKKAEKAETELQRLAKAVKALRDEATYFAANQDAIIALEDQHRAAERVVDVLRALSEARGWGAVKPAGIDEDGDRLSEILYQRAQAQEALAALVAATPKQLDDFGKPVPNPIVGDGEATTEAPEIFQTKWGEAIGAVQNAMAGIFGDNWKDDVASALNTIGAFADAASGIFAGLQQRQMQDIDAREAKEMARFDAMLAAENLTEENKKALLKQRAAAEEKYEAERRRAARHAAKQERAAALFSIALQTARNVVEAFPNPLAMALAGALGATQAAGVLAQPLPALNKGGIVPGWGPDRDSTLAMLTPGEAVVTRRSVGPNRDLLAAMNAHPGQRVGGMGSPDVVAAIDRLSARIDNVELVARLTLGDRDVYEANARWGELVDDYEVR